MQNKAELSFPTFPMPSSPLLTNSQKLYFAGARLQAQAFKAMMRYQIETLAFLKHRYEQDVQLIDDLAANEEFGDAFDVFSSFVQNAVSDYATEAGKVATIGSKLASDMAKRVRKEAGTAIEDIAARSVA